MRWEGLQPPQVDDRDRAIIAERLAALDKVAGPRVGDFIRVPDGRLTRIAYVWDLSPDDDKVQTVGAYTEGGSFYLGAGYTSYSGGLWPGMPRSALRETDETRDGSVWIFHHDVWGAGRGVHTTVPFRVWASDRMPRE